MSLELDIASLLSPFDGEFRGGTDLREDDDPNNSYRRIRDARNEAREEERQADINGESSASADRSWQEVWDNGMDYLQSVAKDVEIVAYMIEASIRLDGYAGLAKALTLTKELVETFWGELLPTPDEDGIETTLRPISRLNGDVITYALMRVPVTDDTSVGEMAAWQFAQAKQLETLAPEERETRVSAGAVTMERFNRAVAETPVEFFQQFATSLEAASKAVKALQDSLEQLAGDAEAPNFSRFEQCITEAESILRQVAGDRLAAAQESSANTGEGSTDSSGDSGGAVRTGGSGSSAGALGSRDDAFKVLETVAQWFERHEPQSILPSEIRKAIRRGKMSPQELYQDLISDTEIRRQLFRDVGIEVAEEE